MHFTPAIAIGLGLGLANLALWRFSIKRFFRKGAQKGFLILSIVKLGILAGIIWILITHYKMNPAGFLLGFSMTVVLALTKGLIWN